MKRKIYLIDGNNFIYRMFFGLPEFSTKDGKIVNAIFGMAKFFVHQLVRENPDYIFFVKDAKGGTFRDELYSEYKGTRERMPDNLRDQISDIESMIKLFQVPIIEEPGYEADDVIGTLAVELGKDSDNEIFILTGDKDLYSLVTENVKIYDTMKKKISGPIETREKFGIDATMIIDYLAIVGDSADNIPGIAGFGPKKAVTMINDIGSIEDVYKILDSGNFDELSDDAKKIFKGKALEKLSENRENAFLSKKLATVCLDVPNYIGINSVILEDYKFIPENYITPAIIELFKNYEFHSLIPAASLEKPKTYHDISLKPIIITTDKELENIQNKISDFDEIVFDTETTSLTIIEAELVGISIYLDEDNIYYVNRLHSGESVTDKKLYEFLKELLNHSGTIIGHNIKYDLQIVDLFMKDYESGNNNSDAKNDGQMNLGL